MSVPSFKRGAMVSASTEEEFIYDAYRNERLSMDEHMRRVNASQALMNNPLIVPNSVGVYQAALNTASRPTVYPHNHLKTMICMRMHIIEGEIAPFEFLEAHRSGDMVHVFVVQNSKPVTLSDEYNMFPSDSLITKLNLLRK